MDKNTTQLTEQLVASIIDGMQELKAHNIVTLDLRSVKNAVTDFYVICHGESTTQVDAIARSVDDTTFEQLKDKPFHKEGMMNSEWILLDYVNVIVHVFNKETREIFDIEGLWGDAKIQIIED